MKVYKCLPTVPVEDPFKLSYEDILKEPGVYKPKGNSAYFIVVDGPFGNRCVLYYLNDILQLATQAWANREAKFKKVNNAKVIFDIKED